VAGLRAYEHVRREERALAEVAQLVKSADLDVAPRVEKLVAQVKGLEKELDRFKHKVQSSQAGDAATEARVIDGVKVLARRVDGLDAKDLRDFGDKLRDKLGSGIIGLGAAKDDKVSLIVMVTKDLTGRFQAGQLIKDLAAMVGGTGGGKPDLAQAGGKDAGKLDAALGALYAAVEKITGKVAVKG
jgi:alanyl-tRNA synthetase